MPSWEGAAVLSSEPGSQVVVVLGATVDGTLGSSQPPPQGLVEGSKALSSGHNEVRAMVTYRGPLLG